MHDIYSINYAPEPQFLAAESFTERLPCESAGNNYYIANIITHFTVCRFPCNTMCDQTSVCSDLSLLQANQAAWSWKADHC